MTYLSVFELIGLVIACSMICWGFMIACRFTNYEQFDKVDAATQRAWPKPAEDEKEILWWVRYYGSPILGKYWSKPVFGCVICMASLHSLVPTWLFMDYLNFYMPYDFFVLWPIIATATAGLNGFLAYNFNTE